MSSVVLTIIGCSDAFCSGGRGNTCFHISAAQSGILIDFGATALFGMRQQGLTTDDIDTIILTHFHGDHAFGLPFFLLDAGRLKRRKPLTIITPPGGRQWIALALSLAYPGTAEKLLAKLEINYHEYCGHDTLQVAGITLQSFPVIHSPESEPHGLRITVDSETIAYTGDTEWTDEIIPLMQGADIGICECTFFEKEEKNHINYKTLRQYLPQLKCRRLLLSHFDEEMLQHMDEIEAECAYDGLRIGRYR